MDTPLYFPAIFIKEMAFKLPVLELTFKEKGDRDETDRFASPEVRYFTP